MCSPLAPACRNPAPPWPERGSGQGIPLTGSTPGRCFGAWLPRSSPTAPPATTSIPPTPGPVRQGDPRVNPTRLTSAGRLPALLMATLAVVLLPARPSPAAPPATAARAADLDFFEK